MVKDANGRSHLPEGSPGGTGRFARDPDAGAGDFPQLERPGNPLRSVKGLAALLYRMGRTFDGLNTTRMATEEFLRTGNPGIIGSRNDYALLQDLRDASEYVLDTDYSSAPFDLGWLKGINASMTRTAAMEPGVLRDAENVVVNTPDGPYVPPVPDEEALRSAMDGAGGGDAAPLDRAARLFARLAKAQPFGDDNKRSAPLAANGLLLRDGSDAMLAVPRGRARAKRFQRSARALASA